MRLDLERLCGFCNAKNCVSENSDCILNTIIYENKLKILLYNMIEKRIFVIKRGKGLNEIGFKEAIREIDIIPEKKPEWKRVQILKLAKELGFFGLE